MTYDYFIGTRQKRSFYDFLQSSIAIEGCVEIDWWPDEKPVHVFIYCGHYWIAEMPGNLFMVAWDRGIVHSSSLAVLEQVLYDDLVEEGFV